MLDVEPSEWRSIANQRPFTNDEHRALMNAIGATPDALTDRLSKPQTPDVDRLMPDEAKYYYRLLSPLEGSHDFEEFVATELGKARRAIIKTNRKQGLRRIAYSALSQLLIPFDDLSSFTISEISDLVDSNDPFSLLFGFEICRYFFFKDP